MVTRHKISTTVSAETLTYLEELVKSGKARTVAEALDLSMKELRAVQMRERLERDTAAYFERLPPDAYAAEADLESALSSAVDEVDLGW